MSVESLGNDGFVVAGEHIQVYVLLSIQKTLKLEVKTGMKFSNRVNVAQQARDILEHNGIKAPRNKAKLFDTYNKFLNDIGVIASY
ncbi:MAG: hypothetical protein ACO24H_10020 [Polynucleobacter sp.]